MSQTPLRGKRNSDTEMLADAEAAFVRNKTSWHILIVDDEEMVAYTLQEGLNTLPDCDIVTTTDPQEALQLLRQHPVDLLITDYKMPEMDGLILAAQTRQLSSHTAIILITAHNEHSLRERAAGLAIQHILNKPVRLEEIRDITLAALNACEHRQTRTVKGHDFS